MSKHWFVFAYSKAIIKKDGNTSISNQQLPKRINSGPHLEVWQVEAASRKGVWRINSNNNSIKQSNNSNSSSNRAFSNPVHIKVQDQHKIRSKVDNNNNNKISNCSTSSHHSNNTSSSIQRKQTALDRGLC